MTVFGLMMVMLCKVSVGKDKVKVGVLSPVQQPGSYWQRSSAESLVEVEPTHRGDSVDHNEKYKTYTKFALTQ